MKKLLLLMSMVVALLGLMTIISACDGYLAGLEMDTEPASYTVTFESNGNVVTAYSDIAKGDTIQKPADPVKAHHEFGGWYKDAGYNELWNFKSTPVLADLTLYAKWNSHFEYEDTDGGCLVTGLTTYGKKIKNLEIPASVEDKKVVGLGQNAFYGCLNIESAVIPDGIERIASGAFGECRNLASVTLPANLTEIQAFAFNFCVKLTEITLPDSLRTIEHGAFSRCSELEAIHITEHSKLTKVQEAAFDQTKWFSDCPEGYVYLNTLLYTYKGKIPDNSVVRIEEGTVAIASGAFYEQSGMKEVHFPQSLTTIHERAFIRTGIETVHLTEGITDFSAACFMQNDLTHLTLADGNEAFCLIDGVLYDNLRETLVLFPSLDARTGFSVPDGVKAIGHSAFGDNKFLTSVTLPDTLETIGVNAFISSARIKFLELPGGVREIGQQAFDFSGITYVRMDGDVPAGFFLNDNIVFFVDADKVAQYKAAWNIGSSHCKVYSEESLDGDFLIDNAVLIKYFGSETDVTVPDGVEVIGAYAFYRNKEIRNVVLPEGVAEIKAYAFSSSGLRDITLPNSLKIIGDSAFHFCQELFNDFYIPAGVEKIYAGAFRSCFNLDNFVVDGANTRYYAADGVLFDSVSKMLVCYPNRNAYSLSGVPVLENTYTVPDGIERIEQHAFTYAFIKNIILPDSLLVICDDAFFACEFVESLTLPEGVTHIGSTAFTYCDRLTSLVIPASVTHWGISPFRDFQSNQTIYFRGPQSAVPEQILNCDAQFVFAYTD